METKKTELGLYVVEGLKKTGNSTEHKVHHLKKKYNISGYFDVLSNREIDERYNENCNKLLERELNLIEDRMPDNYKLITSTMNEVKKYVADIKQHIRYKKTKEEIRERYKDCVLIWCSLSSEEEDSCLSELRNIKGAKVRTIDEWLEEEIGYTLTMEYVRGANIIADLAITEYQNMVNSKFVRNLKYCLKMGIISLGISADTRWDYDREVLDIAIGVDILGETIAEEETSVSLL